MKTVTFKEAYEAYLNGHIIQSPQRFNYQRAERRLNRIEPELVFKEWRILELHEEIMKVVKWNFIYKLYNQTNFLISEPFENEDYFKCWLYDSFGDEAYLVDRIDASGREYDVIVERSKDKELEE